MYKFIIALCALLLSFTTHSQNVDRFKFDYEVVITNITKGQSFTPIIAASHQPGIALFRLGKAASKELAVLAESGNPGPLQTLLEASNLTGDIQTTAGVLAPGKSVRLKLSAPSRFTRLSMAAMLIPTNDAFMAINNRALPGFQKQRTYLVTAYDAGSEENDELCLSIPGPPSVCNGEPLSAADGEGYVYTHSGIHGIGDLKPSQYDWNNPVARVVVKWVGVSRKN